MTTLSRLNTKCSTLHFVLYYLMPKVKNGSFKEIHGIYTLACHLDQVK